MRSAYNATNAVQPAPPASPTRTRAAKTSPSFRASWAHSHRARTSSKSTGGQKWSAPPSQPSSGTGPRKPPHRHHRTVLPTSRGQSRKPHPVATAVGLSMWDHTTGGRSHAVVLMPGPPHRCSGCCSCVVPRLGSRGPDPTTYRRIGEAYLPHSPTGLPHRAPTCDPARPHPVSLRTRTTPRAPLTVVISDRSSMSLTLGAVSVDYIRDREETSERSN